MSALGGRFICRCTFFDFSEAHTAASYAHSRSAPTKPAPTTTTIGLRSWAMALNRGPSWRRRDLRCGGGRASHGGEWISIALAAASPRWHSLCHLSCGRLVTSTPRGTCLFPRRWRCVPYHIHIWFLRSNSGYLRLRLGRWSLSSFRGRLRCFLCEFYIYVHRIGFLIASIKFYLFKLFNILN